MRVLWPHTYPPGKVSGIFMKRQGQGLSDIGISVDLEYLGKIHDPFVFCSSLEKIKRLAPKYDLIHAQYGSGCGYLVSKVNAPRVITLAGTDLYGWRPLGLRDKLREFISRRMTRACLKRYLSIIVQSHRMKRMLCNALQEKTVVIPNGVDLDEFFPIPREEARRSLTRKSPNPRWILYYPGLAGSASVKRPSLARATIDVVRKHVPDVDLIEAANIPPEKMNLVINACDVVLLTSTHEGWPNIIKEAMACNVPFVATDVSDLKEIAKNSPGCSVAEADTVEELARGILKAFEIIDQYGRQDLRKNIAFMRTACMANRLKQVYEIVLSERQTSVDFG